MKKKYDFSNSVKGKFYKPNESNKVLINQSFYCDICKKDFKVKLSEVYHNYNCPTCGCISRKVGHIGLLFKGLDTVER